VLRLLAEGNSNKEMANLLSISIKTVDKHRQAILEKLNLHDTASLTRYAVAQGVIDVPPGPRT
jgi:DNA-binding NarL/FixJ family response regulator